MEELGLVDKTATTAPVLIVRFPGCELGQYERTARELRAAGIGVEVFPDAKKIGQQLAYAGKRGFRIALIAGPDELAKGVWQVKDLKSTQSREVPAAQLVAEVKRLVSA
jgi:histidyl-tRNA synthetase